MLLLSDPGETLSLLTLVKTVVESEKYAAETLPLSRQDFTGTQKFSPDGLIPVSALS